MKNILNLKTKNIAITDLETSGLDPYRHEILEIGLVLIEQPSFDIIDTLDIKVKPQNISTASSEALRINGYNEQDWKNAIPLREAMTRYFNKVKGATFCAYNVSFDLPFILQATKKTNIPSLLDYHTLDIPSLVLKKYKATELKRLNLNYVAGFLGLTPEPSIHRAINGAMLAYNVLKKLSENEKYQLSFL
jgi:DNA polymerase III subunit epsilon